MKQRLSAPLAGNILLGVMLLVIFLHILILLGIVPSSIVWGGAIQSSPESLYVLEGIALLVSVTFAYVVAVKTGYIKAGRGRMVIYIGAWVIFAFFILNTLGNLASGVSAENWLFAPITVLLAALAFRLAIEK